MSNKNEKLAQRLGTILARLNAGERLYLKDLEIEFNVHERTILRDFNRLSYLPLQRENGCYFLDMKSIRNQSSNNLNKLIYNMGLEALIPIKLPNHNWKINGTPPLLFKNVRIEDVSKHTDTLASLVDSIIQNQQITFIYQGKNREHVHPYRLVNDRGIWYLAGTHRDTLHSFRLTNISGVIQHDDNYKPSPNVREDILKLGMQWLSSERSDVLIQVDGEVATRFLEGNLLPNMQILKEMNDGSLLINSQVLRLYDALPILKAWMPHVEILAPVSLKYELIRDLYASIERANMM